MQETGNEVGHVLIIVNMLAEKFVRTPTRAAVAGQIRYEMIGATDSEGVAEVAFQLRQRVVGESINACLASARDVAEKPGRSLVF